MTAGTPEQPRRQAWGLFLVSVLALYAELVVIRWLASEVRVFAYFKNLPLMASFLGLGLGCARWRSPWRLFPWFPLLFALLCLVPAYAESLDLTHLQFPDQSMFLWAADDALPLSRALRFLGLILGIFFLVVANFAALGEKLGELFEAFPPLTSYSINVVGSLSGILAFSAIAFGQWPPVLWVSTAVVLSMWFFRRPLALAILGGTLALVAWAPAGALWSPYYRIDFSPLFIRAPGEPAGGPQAGYNLDVNRDFHQRVLDMSEAFRRRHPGVSGHQIYRHADLIYNLPYRVAPARQRVLVVGAGTGNDVAAALRNGAREVVAVEIDPIILELGRRFHPEGPYAAPEVRVVNADARAFFRQSDGRYDLIVFGYLDSHTMFSSLSLLRLDNYVYTVESLREAIGHLTPQGIIALTFMTDAGEWIGQRLNNTLREAWGQEPLALTNGRDLGVTFVAGPGLDRAVTSRLETFVPWRPVDPSAADRIRPATDDWPFLYMNPDGQPTAYLLVLGLILGAAWLIVRRVFQAREARFDWHMFFLGGAFMLVEVKSIAELSLLFGSTWLVNSAVFSGILLMILAANGVVAWRPQAGTAVQYGWLAASLLLPALTGLGWLNGWPFGWRAAIGTLATSLPIFFAGMVFARSFRRVGEPSAALAANMFGALIGGMLEYASLLAGIRSLTFLALLLYALSWLALAFRGWRLAWDTR